MDEIEKLVELSVLRVLGFVTLGIGTLMLGLSYDLPFALETGAVLTLLVAGILFLFSCAAPYRDVKRTDAWVSVKKELMHLPRDRIQQLLGHELQKIYLRYSKRAGILGAAFLSVAFALRLVA